MSHDRAKLIEDAIALRGVKSASDIAAMHGVSKGAVIGIWWRRKLPPIPRATVRSLISRKRRGQATKGIARFTKPYIRRDATMPSQAKLAATPRPKADWWSEKYLGAA